MTASPTKQPTVIAVDRMPARRVGRPSVDVAPLREAIRDGKPHAVTEVASQQQRRLWRRRLRKAAHEASMRVETVFIESEGRLYFQGRPLD
jgi:hypothetical protein